MSESRSAEIRPEGPTSDVSVGRRRGALVVTPVGTPSASRWRAPLMRSAQGRSRRCCSATSMAPWRSCRGRHRLGWADPLATSNSAAHPSHIDWTVLSREARWAGAQVRADWPFKLPVHAAHWVALPAGTLGRIRPSSTNLRLQTTKLGPATTQARPGRPNLAGTRPSVARRRPMSSKIVPVSAQIGPISTKLGVDSANLDQGLPRIDQTPGSLGAGLDGGRMGRFRANYMSSW